MSIATNWGTTAAERQLDFPCDRLLPEANAAYFRGVSVRATPAIAFRWLCQLRVASYSYLSRGPRTLSQGMDELALGQRFMGVFDLADFERDRQVTLQLRFDTREARSYAFVMRDLFVSYRIMAAGPTAVRLLEKMVVNYQPGPAGRVARVLGPWLDVVMARRQLLNLKRLAERSVDAA